MFVVFLVNCEPLLVWPVLRGDPCDVEMIVVRQLGAMAVNLCLAGMDGGEEEILEVAVVAEGRRLDDDFLEHLDELDRQVSRPEDLDGSRDVVGISRLGEDSAGDLSQTARQ